MATFTSSLPDKLLDRLSEESKNLKVPKNKIIQKALEYYLEKLDRAAFLKSYKKSFRRYRIARAFRRRH